jgi:uncharacterized repeat protein (TIGR03803 family)
MLAALALLLAMAGAPGAQAQTFTLLHTFAVDLGDGGQPVAGLLIDASGNLYGTTMIGGSGSGGYGTAFELVNNSGSYAEHVLYSLPGGADGAGPEAGLVMDASGNLYGTTSGGGAHRFGTAFELSVFLPFSHFAAKLDVARRGFIVDGEFTLATGATAFDALTQGVVLKVGTYMVTIPPGSFRGRGEGAFHYAGVIDGVRLDIRLEPEGRDHYRIRVAALGVDLTALPHPVTVTLSPGENTGTTEASTTRVSDEMFLLLLYLLDA